MGKTWTQEQAEYWRAQEKEHMEAIGRIDAKKDPGAYAVALGLNLVVARLGALTAECRSIGWGNAISREGHGAIESATMEIKRAIGNLASAVRAAEDRDD